MTTREQKLRELVERWRDEAQRQGDDFDDGYNTGKATSAHELASILNEEVEVSAEMVVTTAPQYIYLQISDDESDKDEPFPDESRSEITWCSSSVMECEVKYIRADMAELKEAGK